MFMFWLTNNKQEQKVYIGLSQYNLNNEKMEVLLLSRTLKEMHFIAHNVT